jgi:rhamnose utilization protein RhaD (predicted bifunctional aldolase and dehydrogenase)/NAD(P)-dependent dehydrogenase (short-subunit alcohol dehydrogenase family)
MKQGLEDVAALSRRYGADPGMVIAGGGNTSVKDGDRLWIKASGAPLAEATPESFVELRRAGLVAAVTAPEAPDEETREAAFKEAVLAARAHPELGQRPSVESVLHHLMPQRFIVHTHPVAVNVLTCALDGERVCRDLFGDSVLWLPYTDPGITAARRFARALGDLEAAGRPAPEAVLIQNHGLFVGADTPEGIVAVTDRVLEAVSSLSQADPAEAFGPETPMPAGEARRLIETVGPCLRALLGSEARRAVVTFDDSPYALALAAGAEGRETALGGPLTPDQIVYCGRYPMWVSVSAQGSTAEVVSLLRDAVTGWVESRGGAPKIILLEGVGLFAAGDTFKDAATARDVYLSAIKVMAGARRLGGIRYLPERDQDFIDRCEAEAYRRGVAAGARRGGRVEGKVALVTGAAQGFGRGIAQSLAAAGAHVALADLQAGAAEAAASEITLREGAGRAMAVPMDVTSEESVAEAVHRLVRTFGGFDVVVSNAGVLRAGSVKTQSSSEFRFVTDVNYIGYFNVVHATAPVLALQNAARQGPWADIIQINSKSGLQGSNRNGAYAGAKFGGIGLTQSFALELVEDRIKVNAVCPGNYLDGPLWSDPETGLFAQYLRSGKVPGAQTVDDVRRYYESRVPMGRGCAVADVMKAVFYIIEQDYETGQAVPVTGGQVMLG